MCVILGNLLDNANEATLSLPEDKRIIRVYMDVRGSQMYLSVTNFTAGKKQKKVGTGSLITKGEDHGFGLVRMDSVVKRLGGYINRNSEDGAFTTEALLPQHPDSD